MSYKINLFKNDLELNEFESKIFEEMDGDKDIILKIKY